MKLRFVLFGLAAVLLAGCDGSEARRALAACKLPPEATVRGGWSSGYLSLCMQSKGYVVDRNLPIYEGKCEDLIIPHEEAACYRPDNAVAEWLAKQRQKPN